MNKNDPYLIEQAKIFKALGHPSRLLMVSALRHGKKCVCDLQTVVGDDLSTISKHLSVLRDAGVVVSEKQGTNIFYELAICCLDSFLKCTEETVKCRLRRQANLLKIHSTRTKVKP